MKKLKNMTDEELAEYRAGLNDKKLEIKEQERAADEEFAVREALRNVPDNVKKIILEGRVEASGDAAN